MNQRALDLLPDYVLGGLSPNEKAEVEKALADSAELRAEAAAISESFGMLAEVLLQPPPPASIKERLMASVEAEEKYARFVPQISQLFDLAVERVRELLKWAADPKADWIDGPMPGIRLLDFDGGPRVAAADVGFVVLPAGLHFPWHRHGGVEINFLMKGRIRDFDGRVYGPGEAMEKGPGTEHEFFVEDEDVFLATVIFDNFEIVPKPEDL